MNNYVSKNGAGEILQFCYIYMKKKLGFFCFLFFFWKTGHGQFINILEEEVMKIVVEFLPLDYCY